MICPEAPPEPPALEAYVDFETWLEARDLYADDLLAYHHVTVACLEVEVGTARAELDVARRPNVKGPILGFGAGLLVGGALTVYALVQ